MSATHLSISVHKSKSTSANQQHHTERFDNKHKHTNESIDPTKSDQNINLRPDLQGTYNQRFNKIMDEHYTGRRKKDGTPWLASGKNASIKLLQISVNIGEVDDAGKPITKMSDEELVKLYKDDIYPMLESEYGRENIVGAAIHLDESKPHLHIDVVPLTEDGRLSAKEIVGGKGKMHQNQSRWLEKMQEKRPDLNFVRKKDGVNGLELDKLKELTSQAKDEAKKATEEEWNKLAKVGAKLKEKAIESEKDAKKYKNTLDRFAELLVTREDDIDKREIELDAKEDKLNEREDGLNEREDELNKRKQMLSNEVSRKVSERTQARSRALDERESEIEEQADKLANERTQARSRALDERESEIEERADKLANERTQARTQALDKRESELDEKVTAFGKVKEIVANALNNLPKVRNTLVEYIKHAKEEKERKEREEKATQIASYTDSEVENVASALKIEDFESADQHVENLEKVKTVTDEIEESQFEMLASELDEKMDDFEIDESQFDMSDQNQITL